jgi:hypothetical protein
VHPAVTVEPERTTIRQNHRGRFAPGKILSVFDFPEARRARLTAETRRRGLKGVTQARAELRHHIEQKQLPIEGDAV